MIGGSTARGHADRFSDIELGVFWHSSPELADRARAVEVLDADLLRLYPFNAQEEVWSDDLMIGRSALNQPKSGVLVEVANHTVAFVERVFEEVLQDHQPDELK